MKKTRYTVSAWLIPGILVSALLMYIFTAMKVVHHHESAFSLLYGQNVLEHYGLYSGTFVGREAAYVTWALVAAVMVKLFGVTLTAHAMTSAIFVVFVAGVVIYFCRITKINMLPSVILCTIVFMTFNFKHEPYRWFDQVWLWPMNSYGIYDFLSVLYLLTIYRLMTATKFGESSFWSGNKIGILSWQKCGGVLLVSVAFALNGMRGLMTIILPVAIALSIELIYMRRLDRSSIRHLIWFFGPIILGVSLGVLINKIGTLNAYQLIQQSHTVFSTPVLSARMWEFFDKWYGLFDAVPIHGQPIFGIIGLAIVCKFMLASILFFSPLVCAKQIMQAGILYRLILFKHFAIVGIVYFAYLYGSSHQERYLIPVAISSFFVLALLINTWMAKMDWSKVVLVCFILIIPFLFSLRFYVKNSVSYLRNPDDALSYNPNYRLAKFLMEHGLEHGFSSNWATSQLTVKLFSSGKIDLGLIDDDTFTPHWHGDVAWYRTRNIANSFLVVTDADYERQFWPKYLVSKYKPEVLRFEDKWIYIFNFDLNSILNDLGQVLNCKDAVSSAKLFGSVILAQNIPGTGMLGCQGWGYIQKNGLSYARELNSHGLINFKAKPGSNVVHISAGSILPSCGMPRCGDAIGNGIVIYRGTTKVAEQYFEKGIKSFVFKDNIPVGESIVQYVLMPQGRGVIVEAMSIESELKNGL